MTITILVTGAAGYIGSITIKVLLDQGYDVVAFDNLTLGNLECVDKRAHFVKGDLLDTSLDKVFKNFNIDAVMHFAGLSLVGESVLYPSAYHAQNVLGTHRLLQTMCSHGVFKIIFSSSAAVYGESKEIPIKESASLEPTTPYGATKVAVEHMLAEYDKNYDMRYVCLRYFNVAGAYFNLGELHHNETHFIPRVLNSIITNTSVSIYGNDYDTPDGTCVRDYVHVIDISNAHSLALPYLLHGGTSKTYNVGSETGKSILEVISMCEKVTGTKIQVNIEGRRSGDPSILVADSSLIRKDFGWSEHQTFENIIKSAWEWHNRTFVLAKMQTFK